MDTDEDASNALPFPPEPLPRHIAIIMDGNGRWAKERGQSRIAGHRAGAESVRAAVRACGAWGIECLTLYAFSTENWKRPAEEVGALMQLLRLYIRREAKSLNTNNVRFRTIGDRSRLSEAVQKDLEYTENLLKDNTGLTLTVALNYGSRDEILRAVRHLAECAKEGELEPDAIDEACFSAALDTAGLPDPDMLIRTAGEKRLSNYLLWQVSYAEFHFVDTCWPDFREEALAETIREYQSRLRKFGKTADQLTETE